MGPAPTRLPRMAFPPPAMSSPSALVGEQQAQRDDAGEPDDADADREPVEVALGDRRAAQRAGDTATEHVGEAAAATLVQEDQHDHQEAGDDQDDREEEIHG